MTMTRGYAHAHATSTCTCYVHMHMHSDRACRHVSCAAPARTDDEFEKLLAQREDDMRTPKAGRIAGEQKPERDTKRAVDARRLRNLGNL